MREAAKELDPGLSDGEIAAWMGANGFGQVLWVLNSNVWSPRKLVMVCFTDPCYTP